MIGSCEIEQAFHKTWMNHGKEGKLLAGVADSAPWILRPEGADRNCGRPVRVADRRFSAKEVAPAPCPSSVPLPSGRERKRMNTHKTPAAGESYQNGKQ
jgi:hypothetical protein